ncbi:MAG: hypothetical protein V7641_5384 [Blastocatellia bacterium]
MNLAALRKSLMVLLLAGELAAAPFAATYAERPGLAPAVAVQQSDDDAEGVTFDNLLRASSYTLYIEARNIGALLGSPEFRETFEPASPMLEQFGRAMEFKLVRLVTDNADRLQHSRVMMVINPTDSSLPGQMLAIELESEDAAKEFEAKIKESFAALASPARKGSASQVSGVDVADHANASPAAIRRAEKLIVMSPTPFTFKALRSTSDKLMSDDMNFRIARDRFYAEPLFIYYDIALTERRKQSENLLREQHEESVNGLRQEFAAQGRLQEFEEIEARQHLESTPSPATASETLPISNDVALTVEAPSPIDIAHIDASPPARSTSETPPSRVTIYDAPPARASTASRSFAAHSPVPSQAPAARRAGKPAPPPRSPAIRQAPVIQATEPPASHNETDMVGGFFNLLLSGEGQTPSPEAVAIALALENDALAVRALLIGAPGAAVGPVPFLSLPVSGPPLSSEAANYLPADTGILVVASLDWPRFYDLATRQLRARRGALSNRPSPSQAEDFDARRAIFEKANEVRLADLLAATLGNEIAMSVPASYLSGTPLGRMQLKARAAPAEPLMLIAVRDREALAPKLRPLLEAVGVKFANAKATTEKAGDIEINSYGNIAYAFIDNYLMMASSAASIRRAIEARAHNTTLATSRDFHSYTEWQPRATIAQVYIAAAVLKGLFPDLTQRGEIKDEAVKEFLARYRFDTEPLTYAASAEGVGAHYELRIPRRLLMRFFSEIAAGEIASRIPRNESMARGILQSLREQEKAYKTKHGRYGALDELALDEWEDLRIVKEVIERFGYKLELSASDDGYEATMTPMEYGKTGRLSFYTDQSGVVREGDHNGKPASSSDKPLGANREY